MSKHKTAHRQRLEAHNKATRAGRDAAVAELAEGTTLKTNARSNAPKPSKSKSK